MASYNGDKPSIPSAEKKRISLFNISNEKPEIKNILDLGKRKGITFINGSSLIQILKI